MSTTSEDETMQIAEALVRVLEASSGPIQQYELAPQVWSLQLDGQGKAECSCTGVACHLRLLYSRDDRAADGSGGVAWLLRTSDLSLSLSLSLSLQTFVCRSATALTHTGNTFFFF